MFYLVYSQEPSDTDFMLSSIGNPSESRPSVLFDDLFFDTDIPATNFSGTAVDDFFDADDPIASLIVSHKTD